MDDVQVQVVSAEPRKRAIDLPLDRRRGQAAFVEVDLAGKDDLIARHAKVAQRRSDVFLARAEAVAIRRVDEVDSRIERAFDNGLRLVGSDGPLVEVGACFAEAHAAKAQFRDFDAGIAQGGVLHVLLVSIGHFFPSTTVRAED